MESLSFTTTIERKTQLLRSKLQSKLLQIQRKTQSMEQVGCLIVQELKRQEIQMDDINEHLSETAGKLDDSKVLVRRAFGGLFSVGPVYPSMPATTGPASGKRCREIEHAETFLELERFSVLSRRWTAVGVFDESFARLTAFSEAVSSDPSLCLHVDPHSRFTDTDGWSYGTQMGVKGKWGERSWNTLFRKREWRRKAPTSSQSISFKDSIEAFRTEQTQTRGGRSSSKSLSEHRHLVRTRTRTVSSAQDQHESVENMQHNQEDVEIDETLDLIAQGMDNVAGYAREIQSELRVHMRKIDVMDKKVHHVLDTELMIVKQMKTV